MNGWRYENAPGGLETARWYAAEWKKGIEHCKAGGKVNVSGYGGQGLNLAEFKAYMLAALERRIEAKAGPAPKWRKLDPDYQWALWRDCQSVRDYVSKRIVRRGSGLETVEVRTHFPHVQEAMTSREEW